MEIDEWMQIELPEERRARLRKLANPKRQNRGRNLIFRTLLPGVLCFLIVYYIFDFRPHVGVYLYSKILRVPITSQHMPGQAPETSVPKNACETTAQLA